MAYRRCDCHLGDVPHPEEASHKRRHSRCTRAVTTAIRRVIDTRGRAVTGAWYFYCDACAKAIRAYQGSAIELADVRERAS